MAGVSDTTRRSVSAALSKARTQQPSPDIEKHENLMLLCPTHHSLIDAHNGDAYVAEASVAMKRRHDEHKDARTASLRPSGSRRRSCLRFARQRSGRTQPFLSSSMEIHSRANISLRGFVMNARGIDRGARDYPAGKCGSVSPNALMSHRRGGTLELCFRAGIAGRGARMQRRPT